VVQQLVDNRLEGVKLVHEFGIRGFKLVLELGLKLCKEGIGRANLICHLLSIWRGGVWVRENGWVGPYKRNYK
jgi:hypothetical protein